MELSGTYIISTHFYYIQRLKEKSNTQDVIYILCAN